MTRFEALTLAKILAPEMAKETILSLEAEVTGLPRNAPEGNECPTEGWKYRVHIKCMEESTKEAICAKALMGLDNFF